MTSQASPCTQCGAPVEADDTFCIRCGTRVVAKCPECGQDVERTDAFCPNCGHHLETSPPPTPTAPPARAVEEVRTVPVETTVPPARKGPVLGVSIAGLLGAIAVGVSSILVWFNTASGKAEALDIPAEILGSSNFGAISGFELGLILIGLGVVGLGVSFQASARPLRRFIGVAALVVVGLFVFQVNKGIGETQLAGDPALFDVLGIGVYVALAGGLLLALDPGGRRPDRSETAAGS